jgi:uncharacterized membrane protein
MLKKFQMLILIAAAITLSLVLSGCAVTRASGQAGTAAQTATEAAVPTATAAPAATNTAVPAATEAAAQSAGALTIPVTELSDGAAHFYSQKADGINVEVVAVKLPDGSIRTAFNACQVCYDSGKGYYKQVGDKLVCQNCGNSFTLDQVGLSAGGCNPAPIGEAYRTSDGATITISQDVLKQGEALFARRING